MSSSVAPTVRARPRVGTVADTGFGVSLIFPFPCCAPCACLTCRSPLSQGSPAGSASTTPLPLATCSNAAPASNKRARMPCARIASAGCAWLFLAVPGIRFLLSFVSLRDAVSFRGLSRIWNASVCSYPFCDMTTIIPPHAVPLVLQVLPSLCGFLTVSHVVRPFVAGHDDHLLKGEEDSDVVHIDEWLYKPDSDDEGDGDDDDDWLAFDGTTFLEYCHSCLGPTINLGLRLPHAKACPCRTSGEWGQCDCIRSCGTHHYLRVSLARERDLLSVRKRDAGRSI